MITINEYIRKVYNDFNQYINENKKLCILKTLNYKAGQKPDYSDIHIQQLYLLRFAFSYMFEYKNMFAVLLEREEFKEEIKVTSVGCGSMIDYWGLVEALGEANNRSCWIEYEGIDRIDWEYKIEKRAKDKVFFNKGNAANILKKADQLASHIYIFPKSISEFTINEFEDICEGFRRNKIEKDRVHILITLRLDDTSMSRDMGRSEKIILAMKQNGFTTEDQAECYMKIEEEEKGIKGLDYKFDYPNEAIKLLRNLNKRCDTFRKEWRNCLDDCEDYLNRQPILKAKNVCFQILSFDRKDLLWF